jgi:predicted RNase H-like HicB family nuclease
VKASGVEMYTYRVIRSDEDQEYVGLCVEFPEAAGPATAAPDEAAAEASVVTG